MAPMLKRIQFDPISADAARQRALIVALTVAMMLAVFGLRLAFSNPHDAIGYLFVLPVAFASLYLGIRWGIAAAVVAVLLIALWSVLSETPLTIWGFGARALALIPIAVLVGEVAARLRASAAASRDAE